MLAKLKYKIHYFEFFQRFKFKIFKIGISKLHVSEPEFLVLCTLKAGKFNASRTEILNSLFLSFFSDLSFQNIKNRNFETARFPFFCRRLSSGEWLYGCFFHHGLSVYVYVRVRRHFKLSPQEKSVFKNQRFNFFQRFDFLGAQDVLCLLSCVWTRTFL